MMSDTKKAAPFGAAFFVVVLEEDAKKTGAVSPYIFLNALCVFGLRKNLFYGSETIEKWTEEKAKHLP